MAVIVRDGEATLPACLSSTKGLFDEIIIVDTGSDDRTRQIARSFGAVVAEFPWVDDFSAARNVALTMCNRDFIFWMDADEVLSQTSRKLLARFLKRGLDQNTAYIMPQFSNRPDGGFGLSEALSPRLFPNRRGLSWSGRVYEQILPSVFAHGLKSVFLNVSIWHTGFAQSATLLKKLLRNKRLLEIELVESTNKPLILFNLAYNHSLVGRCALDLNEIKFARNYAEQLLDNYQGSIDSTLEGRATALLAKTCRALGDVKRSLEICEQWRLTHSLDMALIDFEAFLLRDLGFWEKAEALYQDIPDLRQCSCLRDRGDGTYLKLVAAKVTAAYYFEDVDRYCEAFLIWLELVRNSAGMFDAVPGLRRAARRILRNALGRPVSVMREVRRLRNRALPQDGRAEACSGSPIR